MRTVFVNPSAVNPSYRASYRTRGRKGKRRGRRSNPYITSNPSRAVNPSMSDLTNTARVTALIAAGTLGGAVINRLGLSHITGNFYMRNGARVLTAAALASLKINPLTAIAAAGAVLAPMVPELETMMLSKSTVASNPHALAAELADLLEADLEDDMDDDEDDLDADLDEDEIADLLD